jgi:hypothetical protein
MSLWSSVLVLDQDRNLVSGSETALCDAIRRGADLRVGTGFRHNEHIDVNSSCPELIREFVDFRITYLLEDRWAAGICNLRMPVSLPDGFGERESISFFMYNQDAQQAIARPFLDGQEPTGPPGQFPARPHSEMPKYLELDNFDENTNAPSSNFIYSFEGYDYRVCDRWEELFSNDENGQPVSGSLDRLVEAFSDGAELKVAIRGVCDDVVNNPGIDMNEEPNSPIDHEMFVHLGSCYYYTERKLLIGAAQPVVRVSPAIPLVYRSKGWDFGWMIPRTDGHLARWLCDPYTLKFQKSEKKHAIRWFAGNR